MHEIDASMVGRCENELSTVHWGGQGDAALVGGTAHPAVACWQTAINGIAIHPWPGEASPTTHGEVAALLGEYLAME